MPAPSTKWFLVLLSKSPKLRTFTAKTLRTLRSSRQFGISYLEPWSPLRMRRSILELRLVWISAFAKMTEGVAFLHFREIPCSSVANASSLLTVANASGSDLIHFRVISCSSVANASSLLARSPRIFTAKTLRTLRSSRQVKISFLPLRPLRLRGENAFILHFRVIPWQMHLLCWPSLTLVFSAKRLARKRNHRSIVGKGY